MRQFANVADDTLASGISAGATSSTLNDASEFPATGDFTIRFESASNPNTYELVTATARAANVLTHGATANAWSAGDKVYQVVAKADLDSFLQDGETAGGVLAGTYPNPSFASDMATQAELDAHVNDATDAHDASAVSFDPTGLAVVTGTDAQTAIEELDAASGGGGGGATIVRKTADESVTSSTTYQSDNHLLFAIGANEIVVADFCLKISGNTSGDFKMQLAVPAGASYTVSGHPQWDASGFFVLPGASTEIVAVHTSSTPAGLLVKAVIVNGANAGNVTLQWAQNTSHATATNVLTNSYVTHQAVA